MLSLTLPGSAKYEEKNLSFVFFSSSYADMENVPSKPSAARVIFFGSGKFLV